MTLFSWNKNIFASKGGIIMSTIVQDPSLEEKKLWGLKSVNWEHSLKREVVLDFNKKGPCTKDIQIAVDDRMPPNKNGDFLFDYGSNEFRTVSVFSNVVQCYEMYDKDITLLTETFHKNNSIKDGYNRWKTHNKFKPMAIYTIDKSGENNAYYSRGEDGNRELRFFPIVTKSIKIQKYDYTSDSSDIIKHETGHSILDILRSQLYESSSVQAGALHEAFGDLTATWGTLSYWTITDYIATTTELDLNKASPLTYVAEQFGEELGLGEGLRNLSSDIHISQAGDEPHDLSRVLSGAIYDVLQSGVKFLRDERLEAYRNNPSALLFDAAEYTRRVFLQALLSEKEVPTFEDIGHSMIEVVKHHPKSFSKNMTDVPWEKYIEYEFERRGIMGIEAKKNLSSLDMPLTSGKNLHKKGVCSSLHVQVEQKNKK